MRAKRFLPAMAALAVASALCAAPAAADEAATIYDPGTVFIVDLTLSAPEEAKLEASPSVYVKGAFSMTKTSDGTPAGEESTPFVPERPVEVRLKGSVGGSFRPITGKAGFKLKFKKADAVLGLRKMTLNNMVQDPSMVHETLAYAAFRANGVPASRTGFAYVRLNGEDLGVYLDLENLDDIALARIFGAFDDEAQHLYEGEYGDDVLPGGAAGFEVDEGDDSDISDLETLIDVVNAQGSRPWSTRVAPFANLGEMTKLWAAEKYIGDWDGYAGHTEPGQERPNNYYLYSELGGRFQMLPWGKDQTWLPTAGMPGREVTFDGPGGVLFNKCLADEACFRAYWEALRDATDTIADLDPSALAEDTAALLASWQAEERAHGRPEVDADEPEEISDAVNESLDFIAGRQAEAEEWLAANVPPEKLPPPDSPGGLQGSAPNGPQIAPGRLTVVDGAVVSRLWVSGAGAVAQQVSIATRRGRVRLCTTHKHARQQGPVVLRCKLSAAGRQRLHKRSLRLRVRTVFVPAAGSPAVAVDYLVAPRDPTL